MAVWARGLQSRASPAARGISGPIGSGPRNAAGRHPFEAQETGPWRPATPWSTKLDASAGTLPAAEVSYPGCEKKQVVPREQIVDRSRRGRPWPGVGPASSPRLPRSAVSNSGRSPAHCSASRARSWDAESSEWSAALPSRASARPQRVEIHDSAAGLAKCSPRRPLACRPGLSRARGGSARLALAPARVANARTCSVAAVARGASPGLDLRQVGLHRG